VFSPLQSPSCESLGSLVSLLPLLSPVGRTGFDRPSLLLKEGAWLRRCSVSLRLDIPQLHTSTPQALPLPWRRICARICQERYSCQIPHDRGQGLVSSLDRNSAHACASTALASLTDTSGQSDNPPVLVQHAEQGALPSTANILPRHGVLAWTRRMFSWKGTA
jgi:hypothetical protein